MDDVLREQLTYYDARAREYDESIQGIDGAGSPQPEYDDANQEWLQIVTALRGLSPVDEALELACGTGIWTRQLKSISRSVTAIDGAPEMIEINQAKPDMEAIEYQCVDLFQWEPEKQFDLVFFAFWLSHVPPSHLSTFLKKVYRATKPGGRVFIVDEPKSDSNISGPNVEDLYQQRTLQDGRSFRIVKVYYEPQEIESELLKQGFKKDSFMVGRAFFYLSASRTL